MPRAPSRKIRRTFEQTQEQHRSLLQLAQDPEAYALKAPEVSGWAIGEHVEHLLHAHRKIIASLGWALEGKRPSVGGGLNLAGFLVLRLGFLKRGMGKAPEIALPGRLEREAVMTGLGKMGQEYGALEPRLRELEDLKTTSAHPILGNFTPRDWLIFVHFHQRHHLAIVKDIRQAA